MNRQRQVFASLLLVIFFTVAAWATPRADHVFIISFDGGKPAVMQQSQMPTLMTMLKEGSGTWSAQTTFPSVTLIAHTSMLTGVGPAKHKVTWNSAAPEKGLVPVPTVFALAKKQGFCTAMFVGKEKFEHLNLPGSLDTYSAPGYEAKLVAKEAGQYIVDKKPNLCFIHFADSDGAGHKHGWGSPEQMASFADEDAALLTVQDAIRRAGIVDDSVLIMTADHGGHNRTHGSNSPEDMTVPWIIWGKGVKAGSTITAPVTTYDTSATALWLLDVPIPSDWDGKPVTTAFAENPQAKGQK
jgi:predicted AlkP superfamily pyrophosphatase or phosphodiesterase